MKGIAAFAVVGVLLLAGVAQATTVGNIAVCYNCSAPGGNNFGLGVQDAPIFRFTNISGMDITNATFTIFASGDNATADTFDVGTIAAGTGFNLLPGVTNDGGSGHTFFAFTGSGRDTSDAGPNSDGVQFEFSGMWNGISVSSGVFAAGDSAGPSLDGTISRMNFLGGGPQSDGPCNNCYYNAGVAHIVTPAARTPEPSSWLLLGTGMATLIGGIRRRTRR